jgi:cell division protein FtsQ
MAMLDLKAPNKKAKSRPNRRKSEKQPRDWRKRLHRIFRGVLLCVSTSCVVCGALLAARMLMDWGYFKIETVRVEDNRRISADEVVALSNIQLGSNIFDLDLERIGRKIEEDPWIATAQVERLFPRDVVIRVTERIPRAVLSLDYLYYVDAGGTIFKLLDAEDGLNFPVITGLDVDLLQKHPDQARQLLREAMLLIDELAGRRQFNLADVSEVHIDPGEGFQLLTLRGGVPIRLGEGDYAGKLDRLEQIFQGLQPQLAALKYIDLNVADRVIVRVDKGLNVGKG